MLKPLTVEDLDELCDHFKAHTPLRATTAHGTHTFDVVGIETDDKGRVLLRLQTDDS